MRLVAILFTTTLLALTACSGDTGLPEPDSNQYRELISAFYVGLAGLQTGEDIRARDRLTQATQIAPGEPAGWANLGLLAVRHQEFETAYNHVERARSLAPDNSQIEALLGLIESRRGNLAGAMSHLRKAVDLDPRNLRALYALAEETEREGAQSSDSEAQQLLERVLQTQPDNLTVLLDVTRLGAKRGDGATLTKSLERLIEKSASWPVEAKQQLAALQKAAAGPDPRAAALQVAFLRNVLVRVPDFRQSLNAVKTPVEFVGEPFLRFVRLPSPASQPAPPDLALNFTVESIAGIDASKANGPAVIPFDSDSRPSLAFIDSKELQIIGGARIPFARQNPRTGGAVPFDFNYDFKTDIAAFSDEGLRLYRQENINSFTDVTTSSGLPNSVLRTRYRAAWTFDFDLDGDLDLLLRPDPVAQPVVVRNNGDGTFTEMAPFGTVRDIRHFAGADVDADGDPDLAIVDENGFKVLANERLGQYRNRPVPQNLGGIIAVAVADINGDGSLDFVLLNRDGRLLRLTDQEAGANWEVAEIATITITAASRDAAAAGTSDVDLLIADLDNSGSLDIVASGRNILLGDAEGKFVPVNLPADVTVRAIGDVNGDGRLDLIGAQASQGGRAVQLINRGEKNYRYQIVRTRAAKATGDQRINSFGIGGEVEIRSSLLTQKRVITSPVIHFGLGENTQTDVARIVWPNGSVQAEFELAADQSVLAEQRLKGSCPMLFAWDGQQISYVKDTAPWSPALGLHINAQVTADIYQTEEWFKIPGDQLAPRGGFYDLRVTAELWEAYYIDHYSLMAVDRPQGTEVFADERFALPPPPLRLYATSAAKPFDSARDDRGQDVSAILGLLDQRYLGTFGKGRYQGITRDHWVELELPAGAARDRQLYLIGHGFLHPTDGSVNIAQSQTSDPPPRGLSIETPDVHGNWTTARSDLGFPAGKLKTIVLGLDNVFRPGAPRKLRLRTNMEIYWDKLEWAEALPEETLKIQRIDLSSAELRWRGFSKFSQADDSSPELPDYNRLEATRPKWRDLIGYYTRHGDVRELLSEIDGRMLIVNAGDEVRLKFPALPPPPAGWIRDYVMVGDGWIKDGDLNSTFSKTVSPLPYRGLKSYDAAHGKLEDEPAYKQHPQDWQVYHTRYVTPEFFQNALRN